MVFEKNAHTFLEVRIQPPAIISLNIVSSFSNFNRKINIIEPLNTKKAKSLFCVNKIILRTSFGQKYGRGETRTHDLTDYEMIPIGIYKTYLISTWYHRR